jgi:hypothetical protein
MTYTRRNFAEQQQEACQKAKQLIEISEQLQIAFDPIDWKQLGMWAPVTVGNIEIASLRDLWQRDRESLLRQVQIKLLEQAALETLRPRRGLKAVMWSPVEVIQPQTFLSFWIITLQTDERIPVIELIENGQRVYTHFPFDRTDEQQLALLFGPANKGEYLPGQIVTIKEHERQYTGEIIYTMSPGKTIPNRRNTSKGVQAVGGTPLATSRYIVDCDDGFPHIVYQSQIIS